MLVDVVQQDPHSHVLSYPCVVQVAAAAAVPRSAFALVKIVLIEVPIPWISTTTPMTIRPSSRAYSARPWPDSSSHNFIAKCLIVPLLQNDSGVRRRNENCG